MKRKILSLAICLSMLVSTFAMMPMTANAVEIDATNESAEGIATAVNYTKVAPFLPAVEGKSTPVAKARLFSLFSAKSSSENTDNVQSVADQEDSNNGLEMSKTVSPLDADGNGMITLETYATGATITTTTEKQVPTDIILVLDQSGSMTKDMYSYTEAYSLNKSSTYYVLSRGEYKKVTWCNNCGSWTNGCSGYYNYHQKGTAYIPKESENDTVTGRTQFYSRTAQTRLQALKNAVTNFTNSVYQKAKGADGELGTSDDVNHRIAMVGFANGREYQNTYYNYSNTELFVGDKEYIYNAGSKNNPSDSESAQSNYKKAFQSMNTQTGISNINASIKKLSGSGGTLINYGIEMANGILDSNPIGEGEKRNQVVVVFTDGSPGWSGFTNSTANDAISKAKVIKEKGTTIYTVGIFDEANPDGTSAENKFMNYVSSNYKNAESMTSHGTSTKPTDSSYYLSAGDTDTLNNIFQLISNQIQDGGSSIELDESAVIKDVMSDYFVIPEGTTIADISVKTAKVTGKNGDTYTFDTPADFTDAEVEIKGNTVTVTNFNFKENYVGTDTTNGAQTHRGKKLIIEIPIKVRDGFWGGNQVPTNGTGSGIYENADKINANEPPVENFISPKADVPISVPDFDTNDTTIYYGNTISSETLYNAIKLTEGEEWKDDYVDLYYNTPQSSDISNTTCGEYDVSITLTPKYNDENGDKISASSDSKQAKVHILVPQITYNDSTIYLGETANYSDNQTENNVSWVDVERHSDISEATGNAPELTVSYNPAAGTFEESTTVNVQVKVGELDITDIVFFKNSNEIHRGNENKPEFTVNVNTCTLTIDKDVIGGIDAGQTFIFTIIGDNANSLSQQVNLEVVVDGDGTATVTGLPVGNYTVTEQTDWSWRYTLTNKEPADQISLSKGNPQGTVTFTNERTESKWLDSNCSADNIFKHLTGN